MTAEERREYSRKYYQANREKHLARQKQYYLEHKDERKQYYLEHKDERKQYYLEHADEIREEQKQYRLENADELRKYRQTKKGRADNLLSTYNAADRKRGFDTSNNITREWLIANVFSGQRCVYCGEDDWRKLGTDRIDNDKPHTPENCVCCCWDCNTQRGRRYTFEEFKKMKEFDFE